MEYRWVEYRSYQNPDTGEHFAMPSTYKKLQFRGDSEWQDVPTQSDAADRSEK